MDKNPNMGSSLGDFLKEKSLFEEVQARTLKAITARQFKAEKKRRTTKSGTPQAARKSS